MSIVQFSSNLNYLAHSFMFLVRKSKIVNNLDTGLFSGERLPR